MNPFAYLFLAAALGIFASGCATNDLTERVIEIRVVQAGTESANPDGLSISAATNLFYDIASRLGSLGRVNSPHCYNTDPNNPTQLEYAVSFTPAGAYTVDLCLDLDGKHIIFRGESETDPPSLAALQRAMKFVQESLAAQHIKYHIHTSTEHLYMIPS